MITKQHFFFGVPGAGATISPGGFRTGIRGAASLSPTALRYTPRLRARLECRWVVDPVTGTLSGCLGGPVFRGVHSRGCSLMDAAIASCRLIVAEHAPVQVRASDATPLADELRLQVAAQPAAIMLPAFLARGAPAGAGAPGNGLVLNGLSANALTQNAPGAGEATAIHGAWVIAVEFAPKAR